MADKKCPKCKSNNITFQREQTANIGLGSKKVIIQNETRKHSCFYWFFIGWWLKPIYWLIIGWWWNFFFKTKRSGLTIHADKYLNHTVAICQNCGFSWKI